MPSDGDSRAVYAALGEGGWIGVHWPRELGGRGLSSLHTLACEERFGYRWLPLSGYLLSVKTIGNALLRFAAPELQERLIPEVAAGRLLFCQGFSEPDAGSDLASLRTRARRDGDRFVVSGRKIWTSSAEYADWVYLAVRTDPDRDRHRGVSVLVADIDTPGITVNDPRDAGRRDARRAGARRGGDPRRAAGRRAARRLAGADGHAGLRAGDQREGGHDLLAARRAGAAGAWTERHAGPCAGCAVPPTPPRLHGPPRGRAARRRAARQRPELDGQAVGRRADAARRSRSPSSCWGPRGCWRRGSRRCRGRVAAFQRASVATTISGGAAEIQRAVIARRELGFPPR